MTASSIGQLALALLLMQGSPGDRPAAVAVETPGFADPINSLRESRGLGPLRPSECLTRFAQDRAWELSLSGALDYEPASGDETLRQLRESHCNVWWAQELDAIGLEDACAALDGWSARVGEGDAYLRHEVRDMGLGLGFLGDQPLYVLIVAAPTTRDLLTKRLPGVAPREWLIADLSMKLVARRMAAGLPPFERDQDLDRLAQEAAGRILRDPVLRGGGTLAIGSNGGVAVYYKGEMLRAATPDFAVDLWFEQFRAYVTTRSALTVGLGLDSRGKDRLEAVWVVVLPAQEAR